MRQLRVGLITGATRGLGRALALSLGETHHLMIGGRDRLECEAVCRELPSAEPFVADLLDVEATAAAAAAVQHLDLLVHSAGVAPVGRPDEGSREAWRGLFDLNVFAVADLTRLLLPVLRRAGGLVVLINSGAGLRASADMTAYSASKFALTGYGQALRESERGTVRVLSVHPGRMDTAMQRRMFDAWGRPYVAGDHMSPGSVACLIREAIEAPVDVAVESLEIRPR